MPTKERLAKKRDRERERKQLDEALGPITVEYSEADFELNKIAEDIGIYKGGLVIFNNQGEAHLHPNTGRGGNEMRQEDRRDRALKLRRKYREIWGKRGHAKLIVYKENGDKGQKLSVRTVQQYFKDFPIN